MSDRPELGKPLFMRGETWRRLREPRESRPIQALCVVAENRASWFVSKWARSECEAARIMREWPGRTESERRRQTTCVPKSKWREGVCGLFTSEAALLLAERRWDWREKWVARFRDYGGPPTPDEFAARIREALAEEPTS